MDYFDICRKIVELKGSFIDTHSVIPNIVFIGEQELNTLKTHHFNTFSIPRVSTPQYFQEMELRITEKSGVAVGLILE